MWANSMTTPLYQSLAAPHGDPRGLYPANELMMSRGRASVSRVQTSSRAGAQAYSETPDPAHGLRPSSRASTMASTYGNLRPSSRLSDFGDYGPGPDAGLRIDVDNLESQRPASAMSLRSDLQPATVQWARPQSAQDTAPPSITIPSNSMAHSRPAGVSRTTGGTHLGLNFHKRPGQHAGDYEQEKQRWQAGEWGTVRSPAEQWDEGSTRPLGRLRWAPTKPNYLNQLQRYALTSGCTKFCPGRRFVDFVSRSDAYLLSDQQRQADERFYPKSNKLHFSRTSRATEPGSFEPYIMQVVYTAGGSAYHEFNNLRTVAR